ncbi:unnamed protein product [Parajaminaea phylloscopi]
MSADSGAFIDPFEPVVLKLKPSSGNGSGDDDDAAALELHVLPFGLTVHRLLVVPSDDGGEHHDLIVGPEDPRDHHARGRNFFGPLVGRYANRLPAGKLTVPGAAGQGNTGAGAGQVGADSHIELPVWGGEGICHHGGPELQDTQQQQQGADGLPQIPRDTVPSQAGPFDRAVWTPLEDKHSILFAPSQRGAGQESSASSSVVFALHSAHGANGFPGDVRVEARFSLSPPAAGSQQSQSLQGWPTREELGSSLGSVEVEYRAQLLPSSGGTEASSSPSNVEATPINLTQHWGFNLSASLPEESKREVGGSIDEHTLRIIPHRNGATGSDASLRRLDLDKRGVPTGKLLAAPAGHAHDWASASQEEGAQGRNGAWGKEVATRLPEGGYDHFYVWGNPDSDEGAEQRYRAETVALLSSARSGLSLSFSTNQSGVQLYSANGQPAPGSASAADANTYGGARKLLHRRRSSSSSQTQEQGNLQRSAAFLEFSHPHATFLFPELQKIAGTDTVLRSSSPSSQQQEPYGYSNWCALEVWRRDVKQ